MSTTEITVPSGDHGAHPAADGTAVAREVTNYDGTFEEAMECGLIEVPPPVVWNMGQTYRKLTVTDALSSHEESGWCGTRQRQGVHHLHAHHDQDLWPKLQGHRA